MQLPPKRSMRLNVYHMYSIALPIKVKRVERRGRHYRQYHKGVVKFFMGGDQREAILGLSMMPTIEVPW